MCFGDYLPKFVIYLCANYSYGKVDFTFVKGIVVV
jgi:hypothetical protein